MNRLLLRFNARYALLLTGQGRKFWLWFALTNGLWIAGCLAFMYWQAWPLFLSLALVFFIGLNLLTAFGAKPHLEEAKQAKTPRAAPVLMLLELALLIAPMLLVFQSVDFIRLESESGEGQTYVIREESTLRQNATYVITFPKQETPYACVQLKGKDFQWDSGQPSLALMDAQKFVGRKERVLFPLSFKSFLTGDSQPMPVKAFLTHQR